MVGVDHISQGFIFSASHVFLSGAEDETQNFTQVRLPVYTFGILLMISNIGVCVCVRTHA